MVSDRRPAETELDYRIRCITERVERDHRRTWLPPPARLRLRLSWKGHLVACLSTIIAGFSGYFLSEFLQGYPMFAPVLKQSTQMCELGGPPAWLISLTVAFGMACVFYFFTKLLIEDFRWAWR